jgi:hypothetical protein
MKYPVLCPNYDCHVELWRYLNAKKSVGRFEGSKFAGRYWVGGCTCGSGREGRELYDARGIYCGITCSSCKRENAYNHDVMNNPSYQVDEPIEED